MIYAAGGTLDVSAYLDHEQQVDVEVVEFRFSGIFQD